MIDPEHLARQTGGDTALQHELLALFLTQLRELQAALDGEHPAQTQRFVSSLPNLLHRIRGAAAAVGADDLAAALEWAEQSLQHDPILPVVVADLKAALGEACPALERLIAARETAGLAKGGESR